MLKQWIYNNVGLSKKKKKKVKCSFCNKIKQGQSAGHSTAAGHQVNCLSNCIFPSLTLLPKMKMPKSSESKIQLCFAYCF